MTCEVCGVALDEDGLCEETCDADVRSVTPERSGEALAEAARLVNLLHGRCELCRGFGHLATQKGVVKCVCDNGRVTDWAPKGPITAGSRVRISPTANGQVVNDLELFLRGKAKDFISKEDLVKSVEGVQKRGRAAAESVVNRAIGSGLLEVA